MTLAKRILFGLGIGRLSAPSVESGPVAMLQLSHRTGEVQDGVPQVQHYGFASSTLPECDHVTIYFEGDRSKGASIASNDQRYRPTGMLGGEVQVYDNAGQRVYLKAGTKVIVNAVTEIDFTIGGTLVGKFTSAGLAVTGAITATGNITAGLGGGDQVDVQGHDHVVQNVASGSSNITTTAPVAGT